MNQDLPINEATLMAYADGELDAVQAAQVENALQQDAGLAARVAQHRALRAQLQSGLSAALSEPIPERLLNTLQARPTSNAAANNVVDLAQIRQRQAPATHAPTAKRGWNAREWSAMAASLIAGIVLGLYALNFNSSNLMTAKDGAVIAQGKLANALTTQLASNNDQAVRISVSFRNHAGEYCRSFAVQKGSSLAGLACREQKNWRVQMLTEAPEKTTSEFRQAGSDTPAAILALIEQQIQGEPLDAEAETTARNAGWK